MASVITPIHIDRPTQPGRTSAGGGGGPRQPREGGGGDGDPGGEGFRSGERYKLAVWLVIAGVVMFFAAISSAMVVRRGTGDDWTRVVLPNVLWVSTVLLVVSSATFEFARLQLRNGTLARLRGWIALTALLGAGFIVAQYLGWSELFEQGIYVSSSPSSSFFYLFTGAHALHLSGGMVVLAYVTLRTWSARPWATRAPVIEASALYWHFMDALWLYLFGLMAYLS